MPPARRHPMSDETPPRPVAASGDRRVLIFDTTLRDGEQAPGCTMSLEEKVAVARQLARLRVDIVEAGFPAASDGDWESVRAVARAIGTSDGPVVCGLARATRQDIERCWSALAEAARPRIHVFLATSDIHLRHKLRRTREEVIAAVAEAVAHARRLCADVEFSAEDATRSDVSFLHAVLRVAIEAGAGTINIPDTVGYATPDEYRALIAGVREHVPGAASIVLSTHCHDDLGMAVANSLAGVQGGARQVECTVNGIGERAGNAALEEVVMSLHTRAGVFGAGTGIATGEIARASRLVAACTGVRVPPNKAVVGANAFAHEAGIHQAGVLEHRGTYEIIHAESVGMRGGVLVLGKHSGRHAFRAALRRTGVDPSEEELTRMFERFKALADQQKSVGAHELQQLLAGEARGAGRPAGAFRLERVQVVCGTAGTPTALVCLQGGSDGDATRTECAEGAGAVDAVCRALDRAVGVRAELVELTTDVLPGAHGTVCEVLVRVRERGCDGDEGEASVATGHAMHADIILATAQAYLAALNRLSTARRARAADAAMGELVAGSAA